MYRLAALFLHTQVGQILRILQVKQLTNYEELQII